MLKPPRFRQSPVSVLAGVLCIVASIGAAGSASAGPVPLGRSALSLGATLVDASSITHHDRLYVAVIVEQYDRRLLVVNRLADNGEWERVGVPLNVSTDHQAHHVELLAAGGALYVAWIEGAPDAWAGRVMLARLHEWPDRSVTWRLAFSNPAQAPWANARIPLSVVALRGRPAVQYETVDGERTLGVVTDLGWQTLRLADLSGDDHWASRVAGYGDTLYFPSPYVSGQLGSGRTMRRWHLVPARFAQDGRVYRLRPLELPTATDAQLLAIDGGDTGQPLLAWATGRAIEVAEVNVEATDVPVLARIPVDEMVYNLAVARVAGGVAVAAQTAEALRVYRVRDVRTQARITSELSLPELVSHLELIRGPNGQPVVSYQTLAGRPVVLGFTPDG